MKTAQPSSHLASKRRNRPMFALLNRLQALRCRFVYIDWKQSVQDLLQSRTSRTDAVIPELSA
jgi:hypothetical protein